MSQSDEKTMAVSAIYGEDASRKSTHEDKPSRTDKEAENLKKDTSDEPKPVTMCQLFRFAEKFEKLLITVGILMACAEGLCMPAMFIFLGELAQVLVSYGSQNSIAQCYASHLRNLTRINVTADCDTIKNMLNAGNVTQIRLDCFTKEEFREHVFTFSVSMSVLGAINLILGYVSIVCLNTAAERQIFRIRHLFFKSIIRQDMSWYDTQPTREIASRNNDDLTRLRDGIGEKMSMYTYYLSTSVFSIVNAFAHGWKLTLVILSVTPVMIAALTVLGLFVSFSMKNETKAYAKANSLAEEVLTAIKTVVAFGGEEHEAANYEKHLDGATKVGIRRGTITALSAGVTWFNIFAIYALALWYGVKLIMDEIGQPNPSYTTSNLIIVFFSVFMGAVNIGFSIPYVESYSQAKVAAAAIYPVIDRVPPIDSSSKDGLKLPDFEGNIVFENVFFSYPSRPDVKVLNGISLDIKSGETLALVGESGCGKSSIIQLIERFYDPLDGTVKLDGRDISKLNVGWFRDQIGFVGQEPVLFAATIAENIRYGFEGATRKDIEEAAKLANAHNFIMELPKNYETTVGGRGTQLSGGQKQRVAIARALVKNPKILLLDEATSALDSESEAVVQVALEAARSGRTTLMIAHRLSTIRNADRIVVIRDGRVVEQGTHEELIAKKDAYHALVTTHNGLGEEKENEEQPLASVPPISKRDRSSVNEVKADDRSTVSIQRRKRVVSSSDEQMPKQLQPSLWELLKYNKQEWIFVLLGCFGALAMGFCIPFISVLFGNILQVLSSCSTEETVSQTSFYSCMFLAVGGISAVAIFLQNFCLSYAGEFLTRRLRHLAFRSMLKQKMGWFDDSRNSVGALCTLLSTDAANVQGAAGSRLGNVIQAFCTLGAACALALTFCWQLALVAMCFVPLILLARYSHAKITRGQTPVEMASVDVANGIATDCITNIRTVASLHREELFHDMYMSHVRMSHKKALCESQLHGFIFGFAQSVTFFTYASTMYYGGVLVLAGEIDYSVMFKVTQLITVGTSMVAQSFALAPDYSRGMVSAARIFQLLKRKTFSHPTIGCGLKLDGNSPGAICFKNVEFSYPSRPEVPVLKGFELVVRPGQVTALVGSSGCGKSTCVQILERFYDPAAGEVTIDGVDISELDTDWLRSQIGLVSQEPILFDRSIAENIKYGDRSRAVGMDEVIKAAKKANIHSFITGLPLGYDTSAGDKGTQLSGGQKQRIAIARALVRNPKLLLLDEATSALDAESENVVQEALELAQRERTCITVAHRLSTIKDAHQIAVVNGGKIVEIGTHDELMAQHGHYFSYHQTQIG